MSHSVRHHTLTLDGMRVFYREAGDVDAPVLLLLHGYPCSSFEFRHYIPRLADRYRLVALDFPGAGYSDTPDDFAYGFDGFATLVERFLAALGIARFVVYLHDFGSWIGLRVAMRAPERIAGLIIQNGDIYEDTLGPKYAALKSYWQNPDDAGFRTILESVNKEEFRQEFLNDVRPELAERISPDLWELHFALTTERRKRIYAELIASIRENVGWFPRYQHYLREHRPPTLIVWGPQDGYMPAPSARAYLRDLPDAELHLLDGGHWLLETNLDEVVELSRRFLSRVFEVDSARVSAP